MADREQLLLSRQDELLDQVEESLAAVDHRHLVSKKAAAAEAVASYRGGHKRAAQTLAASALTSVIHEDLGHRGPRSFTKARAKFREKHPEEVEMRQMTITALMWAMHRALRDLRSRAQGFCRNATLHGVDRQFSDRNALAGLMLLVGFLRELEIWHSRQYP
jgi:hypothetical protein